MSHNKRSPHGKVRALGFDDNVVDDPYGPFDYLGGNK
jgi:hypothetical protein